ncbi:hypothetical protein DAEQUDRAFT_14893 [Daedalea quercina L-15889]|uniref:Ferric oxidoreductase domain-containing protein n=1 Tax=Daedalea quercina L-15889 TaxID=1314783 RepID=A0A165UII0_9APHY|nr:hypothetical protein DAEQUDRAFT_14893 [Daedalea quercina L-15889]
MLLYVTSISLYWQALRMLVHDLTAVVICLLVFYHSFALLCNRLLTPVLLVCRVVPFDDMESWGRRRSKSYDNMLSVRLKYNCYIA